MPDYEPMPGQTPEMSMTNPTSRSKEFLKNFDAGYTSAVFTAGAFAEGFLSSQLLDQHPLMAIGMGIVAAGTILQAGIFGFRLNHGQS
jgi:hypothetical protein